MGPTWSWVRLPFLDPSLVQVPDSLILVLSRDSVGGPWPLTCRVGSGCAQSKCLRSGAAGGDQTLPKGAYYPCSELPTRCQSQGLLSRVGMSVPPGASQPTCRSRMGPEIVETHLV